MISNQELFREALKARENSYCPYSGFAVGAALLTRDGKIFHGCNIENSAFGPTVCAEQCAIFKAISDGIRQFTAIAIAGGLFGRQIGHLRETYPCGVCRQVMSEFCHPSSFQIIVGKDDLHLKTFRLEELLPHNFSLDGPL